MRLSVLRVAAATAIITILGATPAFAQTAPTTTSSGAGNAVTATVNVSTVSVTVSPSSIAMNGCEWRGIDTHGQLATPNGVCGGQGTANVITVTNGNAPATIEVNRSDFVPADGGTHWTLCGVDRGPACTGANRLPGSDQVHENDNAHVTPGTGQPGEVGTLTNAPQCDVTFTPEGTTPNPCAASPGQAVTEEQNIQGPSASTDPSTQFTTTITWTAVAQ